MLETLNRLRACVGMLALLALLFSPSAFAASNSPKADNSAMNKRDYGNNMEKRKLTPEDQARGSKSDVEKTRQIREELMKDDSLSTYAKNVKIITIKGVVHLRGPVHTQLEKDRIASVAQEIAGAQSVQNEIEIK